MQPETARTQTPTAPSTKRTSAARAVMPAPSVAPGPMARAEEYAVPPTVVVFTGRERTRVLARTAFPRRRCRMLLTRGSDDLASAIRTTLVDAVVVDVTAPNDDVWHGVELARNLPTIPFIALSAMRPVDAPTIARCIGAEVADVAVEGVDDAALRALVLGVAYTTRFGRALREPPPALRLTTPLQHAAWRVLVAHAGRPVRTDTVAAALGVTREHISREFGRGGTANLKRLIDFLRLVSAAELSKNAGLDVGDVARVLEFASSSHLSTASQRVLGVKPASLARLRTVDLVERFVHGRTRSRS